MDTRTRDLIAEAIRSVIDELVVEHFEAATQEHQLTSRIGQTLEHSARGLTIFGHNISVITQDIPDKGPGSLEKKTGIDLYVSIELHGHSGFLKGFLVQSKWNYNVNKKELQAQCEKMVKISEHSYVWIYGPEGVKVLKANKVRDYSGRHINRLRGDDIAATMREVLDCNEGDRQLGVASGPNKRVRLTEQLRRIEARTGIDIEITPLGPQVSG